MAEKICCPGPLGTSGGNTASAVNITVNWKEVQAPDGGSKEYTGEMLTSDLIDGMIPAAARNVCVTSAFI